VGIPSSEEKRHISPVKRGRNYKKKKRAAIQGYPTKGGTSKEWRMDIILYQL